MNHKYKDMMKGYVIPSSSDIRIVFTLVVFTILCVGMFFIYGLCIRRNARIKRHIE